MSGAVRRVWWQVVCVCVFVEYCSRGHVGRYRGHINFLFVFVVVCGGRKGYK